MRIARSTPVRLGPAAAEATHPLAVRLRMHLRAGEAPAGELMDALGLSERVMGELCRVGVLVAREVGPRCERCRVPVRRGPLCGRCRAALVAGLATAAAATDAGVPGDDPVSRAVAEARHERRMRDGARPRPGTPPPRRMWTRRDGA